MHESSKFLVVSRGPDHTLHFDLIPALSKEKAEDYVTHLRNCHLIRSRKEKCWGAIALSLSEVNEMTEALNSKSSEQLLDHFHRIFLPSPKK
jgi:hypothetical protein